MCGGKLQLHVLNAHTQAHREEDGRKLGGDGYAYGLDRGDAFAGAY